MVLVAGRGGGWGMADSQYGMRGGGGGGVVCPPLSLAGLLPPPACVAGLGLTQAGPIGL